ncbi:MAG: LON peptidase substrate-binding domain-containing protein, partial [Gammaproteobacteria bacterium]
MDRLPLFPLHAVLFPGGVLPLRIFEARYLSMVSQCLRSNSPFGVCLIRSGSEVGIPADCHDVGTSARITDWSGAAGGLLVVVARGERIFRIRSRQLGEN